MFLTIRFPAAGLALALGLSACGGAPPVSIETRAIAAPAPSFEALREGPTVIVPPAVAEVQAFGAAVGRAFGSDTALASDIAAALADSLGGSAIRVARDSAEIATARHAIRITRVTVSRVTRELPVVATPGLGGSYERSGGGTSEGCQVSLEIEVTDAGGDASIRRSFVATGRSDVFLWARASALKQAVRRAVHGAASHLRD